MNPRVWQGGRRMPPAIDGRELSAFVERMKAMVPHYTPEWRFSPEDPDAGTALFYLAAEMLQENVRRLDQVPLNNFIAFLDQLGVSLQPARPARSHVVFRLNDGATEPVYIPKGTALTAPPAEGGEPLPFETEQALTVTPARLVDLYNVHPARDRIVHAAGDGEGALESASAPEFALFSVDGDNLQEHALYIRHDDLLLIDRPAAVTLAFHNADKQYVETELAAALARDEWMEWSYSRGGEWIPFDRVTAERNEVTLWKKEPGPLEPTVVGETEGRFVRCRVRPYEGGQAASPALRAVPETDRIALRAVHDLEADPGGIAPQGLFYNDLELDAAGYYPFGEHFLPFAAFYVACPEALTKRGSRVRMRFSAKWVPNQLRTGPDPEIKWKMIMRSYDFEKKPPPRLAIRRVQWEYWNGDSWMRLPETGPYEGLFAELSEEEAAERAVEFRCPDDLQSVAVNGVESYWLRVRVLATDPVTEPVVEYLSPWLTDTSFTYAYDAGARLQPDTALTLNNAELVDRTAYARQGGGTYKPFLPIPCPAPAVYAGFDAPPRKGPIRLHFELGRRQPAEGEPPWVEWEALVREGGRWIWKALKTIDETNGFTESGALQFSGPPELAPAVLFGAERVWLRAVNRDSRYGEPGGADPTVTRIYRNAVPVVQQRTIEQETPEWSRSGYVLAEKPVIDEEVWVDETGHVAEHELAALLEADPDRYEAHYDSAGKIQKLWVKWQPVSGLTGSGPGDRHYVIDPAAGLIRFGDGRHGMTPPNEGSDKVRVTYRTTAGARGNLPAGSISDLLQAFAFVSGVTNPLPAVGGGDAEPLEQALLRGPQKLKHRGRAVSAADIEWIVREAEPSIARVKCLPNRNARLAYAPGSVAVVALPYGGRDGIAHFPAIKRKLERILRDTAPGLVTATGGGLAVLAPALLEISVTATVAVDTPERLLPAEMECAARLNAFLDPVSGQLNGQGWEIGERLHASALYGLLQAVPGVQTVEELMFSVVKIENGEAVEISPDAMRRVPHGIVVCGSHRVTAVPVND